MHTCLGVDIASSIQIMLVKNYVCSEKRVLALHMPLFVQLSCLETHYEWTLQIHEFTQPPAILFWQSEVMLYTCNIRHVQGACWNAEPRRVVGVFGMLLALYIALCIFGVLLVFHTYLAATNQTTYEVMKGKLISFHWHILNSRAVAWQEEWIMSRLAVHLWLCQTDLRCLQAS